MAKRSYNADTNKWEVVQPKTKPTPASNTRKKMMLAARGAEAAPKAAPKAMSKSATRPQKMAPVPAARPSRADAAPVPKSRPVRDEAAKKPVAQLKLPSVANAKASVASQKLKGPVPQKKADPMDAVRGGFAGSAKRMKDARRSKNTIRAY